MHPGTAARMRSGCSSSWSTSGNSSSSPGSAAATPGEGKASDPPLLVQTDLARCGVPRGLGRRGTVRPRAVRGGRHGLAHAVGVQADIDRADGRRRDRREWLAAHRLGREWRLVRRARSWTARRSLLRARWSPCRSSTAWRPGPQKLSRTPCGSRPPPPGQAGMRHGRAGG
ncbi:hypothetical protein L1887_57319 [Cichorium endivia]|nr:hypothetical protein L1887_57319 [Cichorium endivia]